MKYHLYGLVVETAFIFRNGLVEAPNYAPVDLRFSVSRDSFALDGMLRTRRFETQALREGQPIFSIDDYAGRTVLSFPNVVNYHVIGDTEIVAELLSEIEDYLIEIHLLGVVSTFVLERRGILALHASAVVAPSGGVAFLSFNKGGKTSLAASFVRAGDALLTDDVLPLRMDGARAIGAAGYPRMRLWPDHAEALLGRSDGFERVRPDTEKRRVPLEAVGSGGFCVEPQPVVSLFVPERLDRPHTTIEIDRVPAAEAFKIILGNGYIAQIAEASGMAGSRFSTITQLVQSTPLYRIRYPNGVEHLPAVRQTILNTISPE